MKQNKSTKRISGKELDEKLKKGEDVSDYFDFDAATKMVNLDIPVWALKEIDREATRRNVARKALLMGWIIDRLDSLRENNPKKSA